MIDDPEKHRQGKFKRWVGETSDTVGSHGLRIAQWGVLALVFVAAIPLAFQLFAGYSFDNTLTGSMEPTIKVGEVVVTRTPIGGELRPGVVVQFLDAGGTKFTHRVVSVGEDGRAVTKGDANNSADLYQPSEDDLTGVLVHVIPQPLAGFIVAVSFSPEWFGNATTALVGGQWADFAGLSSSAPWGLLVLIVAVLLVWWIIPDVVEAWERRRARREESEEDDTESEPQNDIEHESATTASDPRNNQEKQQ